MIEQPTHCPYFKMDYYGLENGFALDVLCMASAGALTLCGMVNRGSPHSPEWASNHTGNSVSSQRDLHSPSLGHVKHKLEADYEKLMLHLQYIL